MSETGSKQDTFEPEAWIHGYDVSVTRKSRQADRRHGHEFWSRSIPNSSSVLVMVHDQLDEQCYRKEDTDRFSFSCHRGHGSSRLNGPIFVANSSCLECSSYEIFAEIESSETDLTTFLWKGFCCDNGTCQHMESTCLVFSHGQVDKKKTTIILQRQVLIILINIGEELLQD